LEGDDVSTVQKAPDPNECSPPRIRQGYSKPRSTEGEGDGRIIEHTANREMQEQRSERKKAVVGEAAGEPEQLFALDVSKSGQCRRHSEPDTEHKSRALAKVVFFWAETDEPHSPIIDAIVSLIPHCVANAQILGASQ